MASKQVDNGMQMNLAEAVHLFVSLHVNVPNWSLHLQVLNVHADITLFNIRAKGEETPTNFRGVKPEAFTY